MHRSDYLIDKSVLARMKETSIQERVSPIIEQGRAATCAVIDMEVLYSTVDAKQFDKVRRRRSLAYRYLSMTEATFDRAKRVQASLSKRGQHRLPIPHLLIAAVAQEHNVAVLHYDRHFDIIASITDQSVEWVVARGTI